MAIYGNDMALEKSIQSSIIKYLNSLPECVAENVSGNAGQKGRPDINACWKGRCVRIEVKSKETGYKLQPLQALNLKKWGQAGALCLVVHSLEEVKKVIK
jgi:uncharacterized protein (DUF39 family)